MDTHDLFNAYRSIVRSSNARTIGTNHLIQIQQDLNPRQIESITEICQKMRFFGTMEPDVLSGLLRGEATILSEREVTVLSNALSLGSINHIVVTE